MTTSSTYDSTQQSISNQYPAYYRLVDILNENAKPYFEVEDRISFLKFFLNTIDANIQKYSKSYLLYNVNWIDAETARFVPENVILEVKANSQQLFNKNQRLELPTGYASVRSQRENKQLSLTIQEEQRAVLINVSLIIFKLFPNTARDYPDLMEVAKKIPFSNSIEDAKNLLNNYQSQQF
jgi:hypothetical protein